MLSRYTNNNTFDIKTIFNKPTILEHRETIAEIIATIRNLS